MMLVTSENKPRGMGALLNPSKVSSIVGFCLRISFRKKNHNPPIRIPERIEERSWPTYGNTRRIDPPTLIAKYTIATAPTQSQKFGLTASQLRLRQSSIEMSTGLESTFAAKASASNGRHCDGIGGGCEILGKRAANSGKADTGFHSSVPLAWMLVFRSPRPSRIHCISSCSETGPYVFPSLPRIVYILTPTPVSLYHKDGYAIMNQPVPAGGWVFPRNIIFALTLIFL